MMDGRTTRNRRQQAARLYVEACLLRLQPGEPLPSIRDMMADSGFGRLPLQRALAGFARQGVLRREPRRGIFRTAVPVAREGISVVDLLVCNETGEITRCDTFFSEFLETFADTLSTRGYSLRLRGIADSEPLSRTAASLRQLNATAVAVFAPRAPELTAAVAEVTPRWAAVFPRVPLAHPHVIQDSPDMTRLQLEHLFGLGHRRIAYMDLVDPAVPVLTAIARRESYYRLMAEQGCRVAPEWVTYGGYAESGIFAALERMFGTKPYPTALVVADMQLPTVYRFLERRRLRIGAACSVVATDDLKVAALMAPPATSVRNDRRAAARLLLDTLEHGPDAGAGPQYVPLSLQIRASTGPAPS